jgi:hypothetical protein
MEQLKRNRGISADRIRIHPTPHIGTNVPFVVSDRKKQLKNTVGMDNIEEKEFDVVADALYQRMDALLKLTNQNIEMGMFGIMDQIRLEQIDQLVQAIKRHEENQ